MSSRLDQEREAELQPIRMETCRGKLESMGFIVESNGTDKLTFKYNGNTIQLFPYSGWFSGKGLQQGRGFNNLLKQMEEIDHGNTL